MKELFTEYPQITDDMPICESKFWKWLDEHGKSEFVVDLKAFLGEYSFDIEKHKIDDNQVKLFRLCYNHYCFTERKLLRLI